MSTNAPDTFTRKYEFRQSTTGDGFTLEGYAAVFDQPTRIANWEGDFTEVIRRGAFARAVRQNPRPVIQFDHGEHPVVGSIPIAQLNAMREDDQGLWVSARIYDNWMTLPLRQAIEGGSIDGMSFRFRINGKEGQRWSADMDTRELLDLDVPELGPVVFPAYTGTSVGVRAQNLADALRQPGALDDLAAAFYLAEQDESAPDPDVRSDEPTEEPDEVADESVDELADPAPAVSAPNPAKRKAALFALQAAQAAQRSNYEPAGLPDA